MEVWGQRKLTPKEADELLVDRFLSIYFWPAQMSAVRPPPRENIFEPSKGHDRTSDYAGLVAGFPGAYPLHSTATGYGSKYGVLAAGRESVAAAEPFDASKLIEAAKIRAATTPQRRIIVVPRNVNLITPMAIPKQEPDIGSLETTDDQTQLVLQSSNTNDTDITDIIRTEIAFNQDNSSWYLNTPVIGADDDLELNNLHRSESSTSSQR